jgi:uncharacterized protein (DUF1501 family)
LSLAPLVPAFLARTAAAAKAETDGGVLVVVQLDGGNDGINTVVPFADEGYARHRKELRLPTEQLIKLKDHVALHPAMRAAADLIDDGRLAIVQGVGYPNPNRSHFESMAIWQTARFTEQDRDGRGWIGRALDAAGSTGKSAEMIHVGRQDLPRALTARRAVAASFNSAADLALTLPAPPLSSSYDGSQVSAFVRRAVANTYATAERLAEASAAAASTTTLYPETELAGRLKLVAQSLKSGAQARIYYVVQPGYDTHAVQLPHHARLLREFSGALKAFLDDLAAAGLAERVMVLAFSEFGRRVAENGSLGTDHGAAAPLFLAGKSVRAGLHGQTPRLDELDDNGDLHSSIDFRQVYATLLVSWLGVTANRILNGAFAPLPLMADQNGRINE